MKKRSLFLVFLFLGIMIIPLVYAENESVISELNVSDSLIQETETYPLVYTENESTIPELNVSDSLIQETETYPLVYAENESTIPELNVSDSLIQKTEIYPLVYAENESIIPELNVSDSLIQDTETSPMVSFDGLSDVKISESKMLGIKKIDLRIPSSIKKYELLTIDIEKMQEKLANNEPITVLIKGVPYKMILHESTGKAIGLDPAIHSYRGILENSKSSEVAFTIGEKSVSGRITDKGVTYYFSTTPKTENGKTLHYIYSSLDVVSEGQPVKWDDDYLGKKDIHALSSVDRALAESQQRNLEQQMAVSGPVDVKILVITDDKWIADVQQNESRTWTEAAQVIIDQAKTELGKSNIQVNLIPIYDASKASELSADPQINQTPLQTFINHISPDYLNSSSADLAFYLSGYDCVDNTCGLGATYGFDSTNNTLRRYGYSQMADDPSPYDGTDNDRTIVTLHEIGHLFDADHQDATGQDQDYNRAFNYTDEYGNATQTVVWQPALSNTSYDYSSINNHGGPHNDNARRISETKGVVASYYTEPPFTDFTATPRTGPAPLTVQFNDTSTGSPTAWEWNFGDKDVTHWSPRYGHTTVALSDGSIVLMGGLDNHGWTSDTWRSTDKGVTWTLMTQSSGWPARYQHSSAVLPGDVILLMGGKDSNFAYNDTWLSADKGATWTLMNASSGWDKRFSHASVALPNGNVILIGGDTDRENCSSVWKSTDQGSSWTRQTSTAPWNIRIEHSAVALPDGSIVLMGGTDYDDEFHDVWRSTDEGVTWIRINNNPGWNRWGHTSVTLPDGNIAQMGGHAYIFPQNDSWRSTDKGVTWTLMNASSGWPMRIDHSSVALSDSTLIIMGGRNDDSTSIRYDDTWLSSNNGGTWTQVIPNASWTSHEQNPVHTYPYAGTYTVKLNATNTAGSNTTTKTGYISVSPPPTPPVAGFTASPKSGTVPLTVRFTDTSSGSPTGWSWDFGDGDGTNGTHQNPIHTYHLAGTYTVTLSVTNNDGSNMITKTGYISVTAPVSPPTAGFTASPTSGPAPLTVTFADQSSGQITSWLWDVDYDGTFDCFTQACEYTFTNPGVYTSKVVVSGDGGFDNMTRTGFINVTPAPNPPVTNFTGTPTTGVVPLKVQFTDTSTNTPTSWSWNFGDNSTVNATRQNPIHTYSANGVYSVSLTATNVDGSITKTRSNYIVVTAPSSPPVAGFSGTPRSGTAPLTVTFTDSSTGYPTSWSWNFGDNSTVNATQKNPVHRYSTAGVYTVRLTVTNMTTGSNTTIKNNYINVTPPITSPVANFTGTPTMGIAPLTVRFTDTSTNTPTSWIWNFGDGNSTNSSVKNPVHTYRANGTFNVTLTATNNGGSNIKTRTYYIATGNITQTTQVVGNSTVVKFTGIGSTFWTPPAGVTQVEYLVVAGGGSGGGYIGGGGGGGGIKNGTGLAVSGAIPVTVGAGGGTAGTNGGNSVFGSITSTGGGHGSSGGGNGSYYATTGGSGGGGGSTTGHVTGADGISGQGSRGGNSSGQSGYHASGGGGGSGAVGGNGHGMYGGNGGAGRTSLITGTSVYYGGGGGGCVATYGETSYGAAGGSGGGGTGGINWRGSGAVSKYGTDGTNEFGGGGGGGGVGPTSLLTHKGGSGVVIIRYGTPA